MANRPFGNLDSYSDSAFYGWAVDPSNDDQACDVEFVVNGVSRWTAVTNDSRADIRDAFPGVASANAGFRIDASNFLSVGVNHVEIRVGKAGEQIASVNVHREANTVSIGSIVVDDDRFSARISATGSTRECFSGGELHVRYPMPINMSGSDVVDAILSVVVPIAISSGGDVEIRTDFEISTVQLDRWTNCAERFSDLRSGTVTIIAPRVVDAPPEPPRGNRFGILFGGGVESLFGTSQFADYKPALFALTGEGFMNNDHGESGIKRTLENKFEDSLGHTIYRIDSNVRAIVPVDELTMNQFATGYWMYFLTLPLMRHLEVGILFKVSELEEASIFWPYDRSLSPRFINDIPANAALPAFTPVFNAFSKIQMFEELSRTPYFDFIYSCLHNTDKRWCGECAKCRRLAEYCRRLGIDGSRIGLDTTIEYFAETRVSRLYDDAMNRLYPTTQSEEENRAAFPPAADALMPEPGFIHESERKHLDSASAVIEIYHLSDGSNLR